MDDTHPNLPTLRIAAAGSRHWPTDDAALQATVRSALDAIAAALPAEPAMRLALGTGLADGAEQAVARAFLAGKAAAPALALAHVAVLPFEQRVYRNSSLVHNKDSFDQLLVDAALVIELDGRWIPTDPSQDADMAERCLERAKRAQIRVLLQRSDLLLVVIDPAKVGDTAEAVSVALAAGLPVVLIAFSDAETVPTIHVLKRASDWEALLFVWRHRDSAAAQSIDSVSQLVQDLTRPPVSPADAGAHGSVLERIVAPLEPWLEQIWRRFEAIFGQPNMPPAARVDTALRRLEEKSPFHRLREAVRSRSATLAGRYRGAFLTNFRFAALATTIAATSLAMMALAYKFLLDKDWPLELKLALLVLAVAKLVLVVTIAGLTHRARGQRWNEDAISERFLAENLRLLYWLPALGKLSIPRRLGRHHVDDSVGHPSAEFRLKAAVCAAPFATGLTLDTAIHPNRGTFDLKAGLIALRDGWLEGQHSYHQRNAHRLKDLVERLDHRVEQMNLWVIACVVTDILLLAASIFLGHLPKPFEVFKVLLVTMAASLPAWVAATNGIREQSEARRLSERSEQLAAALSDIRSDLNRLLADMTAIAGTDRDHGAWVLEALALAESCATLVAEDVAEWSVLYRKDIVES